MCKRRKEEANAATKEFAIEDKCIFRNRRPKSLAKVIDYWIEHPAEGKACAQKYLESAVAFRQEACMQEMEAMMQEVIHGKKEKNHLL